MRFGAIVIGAGAAGCAAALSAAADGADVLLLEKDSSAKSNTALSGGWIAAAPTRFQRAAGFDDTADGLADDIVTRTGTKTDRTLIATLCDISAETVHWLNDEVGYPLTLRGSGNPPRGHLGPQRGDGEGLLGALRTAARQSGRVQFREETASGLLIDGDRVRGAVVGAEQIEARSVLLASGGFGASRALVAKYIPRAADWKYVGGPGATGEAITWALQAGAAAEHMNAFFAHSQTVEGSGLRLPDLPADGSIIVDSSGKRFAREDMNHSPFALEIARVGGTAVEIFDERIADLLRTHPLLRAADAAGALTRAATIEELALRYDIDPVTLAATVEEYNASCALGGDRLGRERFAEPLSPPYYAARLMPTLVQTQGGLSVSPKMEVLRDDGSRITGLFAAGDSAIALCAADANYYSGSGLLGALAGGRIAGGAMYEEQLTA